MYEIELVFRSKKRANEVLNALCILFPEKDCKIRTGFEPSQIVQKKGQNK